MPKLEINTGPELFRFETHVQWVNKATSWFRNCGVHPKKTVCIDAQGRICPTGLEFGRADEQDAFPIVVYAIHQEDA